MDSVLLLYASIWTKNVSSSLRSYHICYYLSRQILSIRLTLSIWYSWWPLPRKGKPLLMTCGNDTHIAPHTLQHAYCTLIIASWTFQLTHCTMRIAPCILHRAHCTVYIAPCILHRAHCTLQKLHHAHSHSSSLWTELFVWLPLLVPYTINLILHSVSRMGTRSIPRLGYGHHDKPIVYFNWFNTF